MEKISVWEKIEENAKKLERLEREISHCQEIIDCRKKEKELLQDTSKKILETTKYKETLNTIKVIGFCSSAVNGVMKSYAYPAPIEKNSGSPRYDLVAELNDWLQKNLGKLNLPALPCEGIKIYTVNKIATYQLKEMPENSDINKTSQYTAEYMRNQENWEQIISWEEDKEAPDEYLYPKKSNKST